MCINMYKTRFFMPKGTQGDPPKLIGPRLGLWFDPGSYAGGKTVP